MHDPPHRLHLKLHLKCAECINLFRFSMSPLQMLDHQSSSLMIPHTHKLMMGTTLSKCNL